MKRNQCGFTAVAGLLVLVIVAIIGGTGWYVINANKSTDDTLNKSGLGNAAKAAKKKQTTPAPQPDPTASWTAFSSKSGAYSLRYPSTWAIPSVPPSTCGSNDSYLLLGGNSNSVGKYCADGGGQMSVGSYEGDQRYEYKASDWKNITKEDVTAGGIQGTKQTATAYNQGELLGALPDGTLQVKYIFYTNGRTYIAIYSKFDSYPDVLSDFNLMVTKTLKFTQ